MWVLVIFCLVGMVLFFAASISIVMTYTEIERWVRILIAISVLPTLIGMVSLYAATKGIDEANKKLKNKIEVPKYELIQEPVYRKIK